MFGNYETQQVSHTLVTFALHFSNAFFMTAFLNKHLKAECQTSLKQKLDSLGPKCQVLPEYNYLTARCPLTIFLNFPKEIVKDKH